jgi:membrane-bound metal-dependent hydrolase YbcI (DUF457 family)
MKEITKQKIKDVVNFIGTPLIGLGLGGIEGLLWSYEPDIALINLIPDLYKGKNKDRLVGGWEKLHMYLHSITNVAVITGLAALNIIPYYAPIIVGTHLLIDYFTHSKETNKYFKGYKPFYPFSNYTILGDKK